jgi:hypothetical protein
MCKALARPSSFSPQHVLTRYPAQTLERSPRNAVSAEWPCAACCGQSGAAFVSRPRPRRARSAAAPRGAAPGRRVRTRGAAELRASRRRRARHLGCVSRQRWRALKKCRPRAAPADSSAQGRLAALTTPPQCAALGCGAASAVAAPASASASAAVAVRTRANRCRDCGRRDRGSVRVPARARSASAGARASGPQAGGRRAWCAEAARHCAVICTGRLQHRQRGAAKGRAGATLRQSPCPRARGRG